MCMSKRVVTRVEAQRNTRTGFKWLNAHAQRNTGTGFKWRAQKKWRPPDFSDDRRWCYLL